MSTEEKIYSILSGFRDEVLDKIPYKVNLVEILGANENSHTTILAEILRYWRNGSYPFLRSFLNSIIVGDARPRVENPKIVTKIQYIDALIYEEGKYAIIIENKINWATDQSKQIQRYIEAASSVCQIDPKKQKNIWVVYLTDDGRKKVSDSSLTSEAKELLDYEDKADSQKKHKSRYLECNYRDDVLPWLKESVLPACRYSEVELIAMLQQYISYLEKRFAINGGRSDELADKYFDTILRDTGCVSRNSYNFLKKLLEHTMVSDVGDLGSNISLQERNEFACAVQNRIDKMLAEDYQLDEGCAITAKMDAVCEWLRSRGIGKCIHRLSQWSCVFIQYVVEGQRFRLQFELGSSKIGVRLFNNDYDRENPSAKDLSDFPSLKELFFRLFPSCDDIGEGYAHVELGIAESKRQLFGLLETSNVAMLGNAFRQCMEDYLSKKWSRRKETDNGNR